MEILFFDKTSLLKKEKDNLEKKLNVKISIQGRRIVLEGSPFDEYEASIVLNAINFGFSIKNALSLKEEDTLFRKLNIKDYTRRKDLRDVRARIIGKKGKTKNTIESITGCKTVLKENTLGIIGSAEEIEEATTALKNLIKGSKQANIYSFLEKMNRRAPASDLGLKIKKTMFK